MVASLISVPGACGAKCANNAIIAYPQMKTIIVIKITREGKRGNGIWHDLRNGIIMRDVIYAKTS